MLRAFLGRPSVRWMLASNLMPLLGVLVLGWDVSGPLTLYCVEALLMGLFFMARIWTNTTASVLAKIVLTPFFIGWYYVLVGGETMMVLLTFYHPGHSPFALLQGPSWEWLAAARTGARQIGWWPLAIAVALMFWSHLRSFIVNYLRGPGRNEDHEWMVFKPFGRVIAIVIVILPGGLILYLRDSALWLTLSLVFFKLGSDLITHWGEHRKTWAAQAAAAPEGAPLSS